ncbi:hypothetical protein LTS18_006197 [Coniosporium uncinatum]|uniref:Uncharacterized protein n=1 Tax=Coniosporium uncinatum TaxID=93489 RepID=A0ACC3DDK1_9PEZI|nr:hypothetical protein LTS18_006197 [Coniosporium uncinatum]
MSTQDTLNSPSVASPKEFSPTSPNGTNSIEQSVKLFKLFEALRNGDTAAISKAIKDQRSPTSATTENGSMPGTRLEGTTVLHLAIQCAEMSVIEFVISSEDVNDLNTRDKDGNTPLHVAAMLGRFPVVRMLLSQPGVIDSTTNYQGQTPLDLARTPDIFQQLQLARSIFIDTNVKKVHELVAMSDYDGLEKLLQDPRMRNTLDVNGGELATNPATAEAGGTLLHEAARKKDIKLIQMLLLNGADPFRRDRKGKLPQDVTKDEKTRAILKRSPAAAAAQRGIQEKAILAGAAPAAGAGSAPDAAIGNKEGREMKGFLKKWTNYTSGWKLRWFVLEDGVLSYYKHQDDAGSACRGAINMKIAQLHMDPSDKLRFEIHGKSSVKYYLRANHQVEAKRWYWALNNAIQWTKDEAKEDERRANRENEVLRAAKMEHLDIRQSQDGDSSSFRGGRPTRFTPGGSSLGVPLAGSTAANSTLGDEDKDPSGSMGDLSRFVSQVPTIPDDYDGDDGEEDYVDDGDSSHDVQPASKDAFNITAQSAKLQLELLTQVSQALNREKEKNPNMLLSDSSAAQSLAAYEAAVGNLKGLVGDLLRIAIDREAHWQHRLEQETNVRRLWEESMAKVAKEQEELEEKLDEAEAKRRQTKRALREALEGAEPSKPVTPGGEAPESALLNVGGQNGGNAAMRERMTSISSPVRRRPTIVDVDLSDESDEDDEFFDAVGAGEVEVVDMPPTSSAPKSKDETQPETDAKDTRVASIQTSFKGYEDGIRKKLKMDADDRPKISLWGILKSMIGKDMTKMTLPVSFNEPTSLLQRVAEDMEYTDLLDIAAERQDPTERMVYVAAFAASEYASTIGRVAKPFNPLLGETYEYARPDKGYRFFIEQVSHHPPIGAAWAEAPKWDYYGESAVRSKFYGKSFDINPLGTWFLKLRPSSGGEELYTWKKVTSSVIGIITGNPTVDNYGLMEVKNHTTGEVCTLDFKARGWKASSAYQVAGKVVDARGQTRWSIGGRWNDKIYARLTPGYEDTVTGPSSSSKDKDQAFLVWECHKRPTGIPFNLTPFVVTLNDVNDKLRPVIAPTDTRLRPDQRAMEDGEYDFAATEKNRVEEKQRARRKQREAEGEEFMPRWFRKGKCEVTREEYWVFNHEYWRVREQVAKGEKKWEQAGLEDIF